MFYVSTFAARVLNRLQLLSVFRIGYRLSILGYTFKIPVIENKEGFIYHLGVGEPYLLKIFKQLYEVKNYVFLDAGVNFGQTLLKIKAVNQDAAYIGFEPSGLCSYYTSHLIKANNIKNARLIRCALSNAAGVLTLHAQSDGDTRATIIENSIQEEEDIFQELVPVITLDSLISIITRAGKDIILKIDVEGAEWMVFEGATNFITEYRPVIVFENLPCQNDNSKCQQQQQITDFLKKANFSLYLIDEENKTLNKIELISNVKDYLKTNYLAVPAEETSLYNMGI